MSSILSTISSAYSSVSNFVERNKKWFMIIGLILLAIIILLLIVWFAKHKKSGKEGFTSTNTIADKFDYVDSYIKSIIENKLSLSEPKQPNNV